MSSPSLPHSPAMPLPRRFFAMGLAAGLVFAAWSVYIIRTGVPVFDQECAERCADVCQAHTFVRNSMVYLTDLGSIPAMITLAVMGAVWQVTLRRHHLALAWLGIVLGGGLLDMGLKHLFDRDRPPAELRDSAIFETNASYPSGHSMGSAIGYGMVAYAFTLTQPCRRRRLAIVLLLAGLVVAIGCSRMMLRAHWFSDVVAGWTVGVTWLCFCLGMIERRRASLGA